MPSLYSEVSNWYWRVFRYHHLTSAKQRKRILFLTLPAALLLIQPRMWLSFSAVKAHCWLNSICCQPGLQAPFLQSYFPVSWLPAWLAAQDYSVSDAVLCICLYWSSRNSCQPIFPVCSDPPKQEILTPVYWLLPLSILVSSTNTLWVHSVPSSSLL